MASSWGGELPMYYHGAISQAECENILGQKNKDGAYLIRDSETIQGAMCLCVYKKKVVYTYRLFRTCSGQFTLMSSEAVQLLSFKSLEDMILFYKKKNKGLAMHLRHSVRRKTGSLIQRYTPPESAPEEESQEHEYDNIESSLYTNVLP